MQIRELEAKTGLERATIRFYEGEGFLKPIRKENGYRQYAPEDVQMLLKIKLLRQLGMSLEQIRNLQQGSADFAQTLADQIALLEEKIQTAQRAKEVCQIMQSERASFDTLDVQRYLNLLQQPKGERKVFPKPVPEFDAASIQPRHPWRRYFARTMDSLLLSSLVQFLLVCVFRIRPYHDIFRIIITYGTLFLMVPLEAFFLHQFGTTPGKWAMGIRVTSENGNRLTFSDAFEREKSVLIHGMGFGVPFFELYRHIKSYKEYQELGISDWDLFNEMTFCENRERRRTAAAVAIVLCVAILITAASFDVIKPSHIGEDLTVAEFADNYNQTAAMLEWEVKQMLDDGTFWQEPNTVVVHIGGSPANQMNPNKFQTDENGHIRSITYQQAISDLVYTVSPLDHSQLYMITVLLSQKGTGLSQLSELLELMEDHAAEPSGQLQYRNLHLKWSTEMKNCSMTMSGQIIRDDENKAASASMTFTITIEE